jgi:hypothetical protein
MSFVVKAAVDDSHAKTFAFAKARTMYGGKTVAVGDEIFIFASETEGGQGLIARGVVTAAKAHAKPRNVARWTPRVSIEIKRTAPAKRALGRDALKAWRGVKDGSAQAELDFKFYRQATNKICGISDTAAKFLRGFF